MGANGCHSENGCQITAHDAPTDADPLSPLDEATPDDDKFGQ